MSDSVDRVFVHALNTVKKIPKTGATRPPPADRMRLYGLYKQAMEGDVDGVMERPTTASSGVSGDDLRREQDKWDAWNSQRGISRTEAKRRYIEALIETIHRYATTPSAMELVAELEFVWNQIKGNEGSSESKSSSSPESGGGGSGSRRFAQPRSGSEGPMKVLRPMSEEDKESVRRMGEDDYDDEDKEDDGEYNGGKGDKWPKKMEKAIVRLSAEIAALREQIMSGREFRLQREKSVGALVRWVFSMLVKHLAVDVLVLALVLIWMRRKKDRRLEDHVRGVIRVAREYARRMLPSR